MSKAMFTLYRDPWFTFRFADDRRIERIHLDGAPAGQRVSLFRLEPTSGARLECLATATVGEAGWVKLPGPLIMRAGEAFVAVPTES